MVTPSTSSRVGGCDLDGFSDNVTYIVWFLPLSYIPPTKAYMYSGAVDGYPLVSDQHNGSAMCGDLT